MDFSFSQWSGVWLCASDVHIAPTTPTKDFCSRVCFWYKKDKRISKRFMGYENQLLWYVTKENISISFSNRISQLLILHSNRQVSSKIGIPPSFLYFASYLKIKFQTWKLMNQNFVSSQYGEKIEYKCAYLKLSSVSTFEKGYSKRAFSGWKNKSAIWMAKKWREKNEY